jgi:hypothetical protein
VLDLSPVRTHVSTHDPDVRYTIRPLTALTRARAESKTIHARRDVLELQWRINDLSEDLKKLLDASPKDADGAPLAVHDAKLATPEMLDLGMRRAMLIEEQDISTTALIAPDFLREALIAIDGVNAEGKPATVEQFIQAAPPRLFDEAYQLVMTGTYIDPDKAKNSAQSTTSGAPVDSEVKTSIAPSANPEVSISQETVIATSQSA